MNEQNNQQNQGIGVDMEFVLNEYVKQANNLNREVVFLKAYINQLESKISELETRQGEGSGE